MWDTRILAYLASSVDISSLGGKNVVLINGKCYLQLHDIRPSENNKSHKLQTSKSLGARVRRDVHLDLSLSAGPKGHSGQVELSENLVH
jgi:hypothetical protein